nr:MAG TPA: tail tape measure protein [Caudoviricetes sp.]
MATLVFRVSAQYDEVIKLRNEISKLEAQLKKMDVNKSPASAKALETQLASTRQQMMGLVTEAAKTGAVMENGFKKKIYDASQTVNGLSEKIIAQRAVIKDIEFDVKRLGDAYRTALKNNPIGASGKLAEYNAARKALDEEKAALFGLTQQQAEARLSVKKLRDEYSLYKKEAGDTVEINNGLSMSWGKMLGVIGGATALKSLASQIVRVRGEFQSMQTAIETMVGKDVASGLMAQLKEMAKISPLTLTDMVDAEKMMLGFNIQAEDTVRYLQALSDISMGDSVKFKSLTLAFSQMSAAGKLMGSDLNQMINAGFNPLQIISEKTGKSISTLKDEMSKGAVSAEMVQQAFIDATSAGGKFYQMSENASKTINGQLSMMQDALDNAFNEMGQASEGVIMEGIQLTTTLIQNYETVGKVLVGLVATYGAYRTAVMLATIATSKHTIAEVALTNARIIARKAQLLLNAAMLTNPYVAVATVITGLVATMWALSDSTTAAEKAQERFCQKSSEMKNKEEERKKSLESLISTINDETTATVARADALNKLKSEYPDIFKKYVDEKGHITDLIELWKEYNDQASVSSRESKQRMVENIDAQIAVTQNNLNTAKANSDWGSVKKYREQLESLQKERSKWVKEVLTDVNRELSVKEEAPKTYAEDYEQARKDWEEAKKELEKIEAEKDKFTSEQYEKAKKRVETTEKAYKNLGGVTSDKPIKDAQKEAERQKEEQQQLAEELLQLRRTNQQDEINLMEEGSEKKRRQIELDYQKEIDEIKKQRKKWEDAQGGKLTSEHREVLGNRASNAMQSREKGLAAITDTENQAAIEANERYLKNYGTFMQKRQAITDEYNRKISETTTQGDKDILQKEMEKALSSLDLEKLKQGINWELVFGDLDKVSKESLNKVKQQLRDFKNSEEYKNMAVDQKKVIDEALNNIQSTLIDKGGLLADLPEQLSELAKAQEELSQAQEEYNEAMRSGTDAQKEAATKKLNDAQKRQQNAQVNVQKSTDKTTSNLIALSNVITQLGSNSEMSLSEIGSLASDVVDVFTEAGSKIGGIIGAAFSLLDAIGTQGLDGFVGNIFSSIFKSVGGIWDTLTFGGFSKLFGIGGNEKEVQDTINRLTDRNEKLQSAIESLTEEMKSSKGSEKSVAEYNKAIKYQEEYNKNVLAKAQANAGYHSSHHSWAYYMGWSESDIQWIRENVMAEFTGTNSLWQMSPEQMELLRQNVDLWQKMADSGKGGYGNSVVEALGEYADLAGNLEELKEGLFEQLTGMSFDSMYDSFIDTLMDMDASAEDFADNISEYFMRAMLSDKIGNMYSQKLEDWWNRFGESMKDGNLSESERNSLQNEYMGYVNEALKLRDELAAATGYDKTGSSSQQSASSRGFGTEMTHEDAGELSGRFTAVYESNLRIETAEQQQTVAITELRGSISALTAQATGMYNIADETRTILANSYLELQQIRENTEDSAKYLKDIKTDIAEVKRNTARL